MRDPTYGVTCGHQKAAFLIHSFSYIDAELFQADFSCTASPI